MAFSKIILNGTTLMDATSATAAAEDIVAPKTAMLANGIVTTGTGSGGGGVGEGGTVTVASDTQTLSISVSDTYSHVSVWINDAWDDATLSGGRVCIWAAGTASRYTVADCYDAKNGLMVFDRARTGIVFSSSRIDVHVVGNGVFCTFPAGITYGYYAW